MGWRGTHVEPLPEFASRLRAARPDERVIEAAVSDRDGPMRFFALSGLSSGREDIAEHHAAQGHQSQEILVPTIRLDKLLNTFRGQIHWLKVDVEGMEEAVLKSWGESDVRPWILVIESTFPNSQTPTEGPWIEEVLRRGYHEVYFDGLSRYFVHSSQSQRGEQFAVPPNVFDEFVITNVHFASKLVAREAAQAANDLTVCDAQLQSEREAHRSIIAQADKLGAELASEIEAHRSTLSQKTQLSDALQTLQEAESQARDRAEQAQLERVAALQSMAHAERERSLVVDRLWRERHDAEADLRERQQSIERELRDSLVGQGELRGALQARELQLEQSAEELRRWKGQSQQQASNIDALSDQAAHLNGEIAALQKKLLAAESVIVEALARSGSWWDRIGSSLRLTPHGGSRRVLQAWSRSSETSVSPSGKARGRSNGSVKMTTQTLDDVLAFPNEDFVRSAYRAILGREADVEGLAHYLRRLESGKSRLSVLRALLSSPEAKNRSSVVEPLRRAVQSKRRTKMPLLGWLFAGANPAFGDASAEIARKTDPTGSEDQTVQSNFATIEQLHSGLSEVARLKVIVEGLGNAVDGIARTQSRHDQQISELIALARPSSDAAPQPDLTAGSKTRRSGSKRP
jgi:FkbM family methyltransferase